MKTTIKLCMALATLIVLPAAANAELITFNTLTGTTPQATGIFRADLGSLTLTQLSSITVNDDSGTDGAAGVWSGFDLAGIKLSNTLCTDAACANSLVGLNVFDFGAGTIFNGGTMDATTNTDLQGPCLFGTSGGGCSLDNSIATLSAFDAVFSVPAVSSGWVSLGRGGSIAFNLTSILSTSGLYLYVGEVGNNGESLSGLVEVSDTPVQVSAPTTLALLGIGLIGLGFFRGRREM